MRTKKSQRAQIIGAIVFMVLATTVAVTAMVSASTPDSAPESRPPSVTITFEIHGERATYGSIGTGNFEVYPPTGGGTYTLTVPYGDLVSVTIYRGYPWAIQCTITGSRGQQLDLRTKDCQAYAE